MQNFVLKVLLEGLTLARLDSHRIPATNKNYVYLKFKYDSDWGVLSR